MLGPHRRTDGCGPAGTLPPPSRGALREGTLRSRFVPGDVHYALALPPGARSGRGLPLVICLPGRGGGAGWMPRALNLQDFAARAGLRAVLAAVDSGQTYWHHRRGGEDRLAMLFADALPLFERLVGPPSKRALLGW